MALPENPLTRVEQYLAKTAGQDTAIPNVPLTRVEQYLAKIAGQDVKIPDVPLTRQEQYLAEIAKNGGGSSITVEPLTVTSNGTQTAPSDKAYSPVTVNVQNSYSSSDFGKVVAHKDGVYQLTEQTSYGEATKNGKIYTTYNNSVTVNVQPEQVYVSGGNTMLSNPFSELDFDSLYNAIQLHRLSGYLYFEFNGMPVQVELYARNNYIGGTAFTSSPNVVGFIGEWDENGVVALKALMSGQVQDMIAYAPQITCYVGLYGTTAPTPAT